MEGIVTLEDLLEEIVGEIEDEFDLPDESVEQVDDKRIRIHGTFTIDDFNEEFHVDLPQEDYNTVGGFVFGELGHAPHEGDTVVHDGLRFTVIEIEGNRDRAARGRVPARRHAARRPRRTTRTRGMAQKPTRPREGGCDRAARRGRAAGGRGARLRAG